MVSAFLRGLRISLAKPHFAIALWLATAALAAPLALPISNFLHAELNRSSDAPALVAGPGFRWWQTQRRVHPELVGNLPEKAEQIVSPTGVAGFMDFDGAQGIGAGFLGLAMLGVAAHAFLLGGIFGSLRDERGSDLVIFAREGSRRLPAFLIVTIAAAAIAVAIYHGVWWAAGKALEEYSTDLPSERAAFLLRLARLALLLLLLTFVKLAADSIRVALVERPDLPPVTRYFVGVGSAIGRLRELFSLLALFALASAALFFLWTRLSVGRAATTTGGVLLLVVAQQVFLFLRGILKVGYYAGVREVFLARATVAPTPRPPDMPRPEEEPPSPDRIEA